MSVHISGIGESSYWIYCHLWALFEDCDWKSKWWVSKEDFFAAAYSWKRLCSRRDVDLVSESTVPHFRVPLTWFSTLCCSMLLFGRSFDDYVPHPWAIPGSRRLTVLLQPTVQSYIHEAREVFRARKRLHNLLSRHLHRHPSVIHCVFLISSVVTGTTGEVIVSFECP